MPSRASETNPEWALVLYGRRTWTAASLAVLGLCGALLLELLAPARSPGAAWTLLCTGLTFAMVGLWSGLATGRIQKRLAGSATTSACRSLAGPWA